MAWRSAGSRHDLWLLLLLLLLLVRDGTLPIDEQCCTPQGGIAGC
jgi:hypothetical protein